MKLLFKTAAPNKLKKDIIALIEDKSLNTWAIHEDEDTKYLKHTKQWGEKGVIQLLANSEKKHLSVEVLKFKKEKAEVKDFEGYYLGRFCEIIFVNFATKYSSIERE
ncbi:hypothetical protein [Rufibacter sp. LB8]|uniref:hypothetical protein n=1 Tax=Rufibacter sp. LB8 TaxID=2777781 RepID=UPI00178C5D5E|nr:hypothetical protein [Rufibacter sp. LB8]